MPAKRKKSSVPQPRVAENYDDTCPYSCLAAAAYERGQTVTTLKEQVQACFHRPSEQLKRLAEADKAGVKEALRRIWAHARGTVPQDDLAAWAAHKLAELGDSELLEREKGLRLPAKSDRRRR